MYQGLCDHVAAGDAGKPIGKRIVLSNSFVGGNRDMAKRYQDAMACVQHRGKPSFFITFTCNPKWSEIVDSLPAGVSATDRPDIVSRVFRLKLNQMLDDIKKGDAFGRAVAHLAVVEFQKRGLPHAHILVILAECDRIKSADEIDDAVVAQIPLLPSGPRPTAKDEAERYDQQVLLHHLVLEHMMHNDCSRNRDAPCLNEEGFCSKGFPKPFRSETTYSEMEIYPDYCRPRPLPGASPIKYKNRVVDNQWVVPYSPFLLLKYQAHINVEVCISIESVKYLYKYVCKGHDRAMASLDYEGDPPPLIDEIQRFQDARCIGSAEACWRLFEFDLFDRSPPCYALPVHLPNEQQVLLFESCGGDKEAQARAHAKAAALPPKTELTQWLDYVVRGGAEGDTGEDAPWRRITYSEFPSEYSYNKSTGWKRRVKNRPGDKGVNPQNVTIGRIHYAHPSAGQRFYARLLLCKVTGQELHDTAVAATREHLNLSLGDGSADSMTLHELLMNSPRDPCATGFEALRAGAATFKEACAERGLLFDDKEWDNVLTDAAALQMPRQMRDCFATILIFNTPADPTTLFESHYRSMGDDMLNTVCGIDSSRRERRPDELTNKQCSRLRAVVLAEIADILRGYGAPGEQQLRELPALSEEEQAYVDRIRESANTSQLMRSELQYDRGEQRELFQERYANVSKLTSQKAVVDAALKAVDDDTPLCAFVDAPGGCGKTYVFNCLLSYVRSRGEIALAVASTGIAAILLEGGRTLHSRMQGAPLKPTANDPTWIDPGSQLGELVRSAKVIVWDEAPMNHRYLLEGLDRTLRDLMAGPTDNPDNLPPFGGKVIVLGGDFRQVLPVMRRASRAQVVDSCIKRSPLWHAFTVFHLTDNMRVWTADPQGATRQRLQAFASWLLAIGRNDKREMGQQARAFLETSSLAAADASSADSADSRIVLPPELCIDGGRDELIEWVYTNIEHHLGEANYFARRAVLAPRHVAVHDINQTVLDRINGQEWCHTSCDELSLEETSPIPTEFLNSLTDGGLPPHELNLKRGVPVMLLRNLRVDQGLCNGTRLIVKDFTRGGAMVAEIITGPKRGNTVLIPRVKLYGDKTMWPFQWHRTQEPAARRRSPRRIRASRGSPPRSW